MVDLSRCYNIDDLRSAARRRLPKWIFEFVDLGAEDNIAIRNNIEAFRRLKLRGRALVDMSGRNLGTSIFGAISTLPLAIAPTGAAGLCWYEGELELARAAASVGVPFTMAVGSTTPLERVAEEVPEGRRWLQVYLWENRDYMADLIGRAWDHGYEALVVTVDVGIGHNREHNYRNGYGNPFKPSYPTVRDIALKPEWMISVLFRYLATTGMPRMANNPPAAWNVHGATLRSKDGAVSWEQFAWLRDIWPGKLLIKGILRPDDAARAIAEGVDGVIISNHGGRCLDSAVAPIDVLPEIVETVKGRVAVIVDSGIRRGSDIVKALAAGADLVMVGRATLWGTAAAGRRGAEHALALLQRELEQTLAFVGAPDATKVGLDVLATPRPLPFRADQGCDG